LFFFSFVFFFSFSFLLALVRPGRFDRHVVVPMPDVKGREQILNYHAKAVPLDQTVNMKTLARGTPGLSGADLANLINQAALKASLEGKSTVGMAEMEYAKDKILMGAERKSAVIDPENRNIVAYHEGGHALVAMYTPGAMPVHKATIMPRGSALGMVSQLPEKDELSWTKKQLFARLDVAMGGRAAEEMMFGSENVTSGASSDIENATRVAQAIVMRFGMSEKVGPVLHKEEDLATLSPGTRFVIEEEVKSLLEVGVTFLLSSFFFLFRSNSRPTNRAPKREPPRC
jgi:ATP-dependent metalloprotease